MDSGVLYRWCYCCLPVLPHPTPQPSTDKARRSTDTLLLFFQPFQMCYLNAKIAAQSSVAFAFFSLWTRRQRGSRTMAAVFLLSCDDTFIRSPIVQVFHKWNLRGATHTRCIRQLCCLRHGGVRKLMTPFTPNPLGKKCCCLMVAQLKVKKALLPSYTLVSCLNWAARSRAKISFTHSYLELRDKRPIKIQTVAK